MYRQLVRTESDTLMMLLYWERRRLQAELATRYVQNDPSLYRNRIVQLRRLPHWRWHDRRWWDVVKEIK